MNIKNEPIFRFKTKKEFETEFGNKWRYEIKLSWCEDKFFNRPIPAKDNMLYLKLWLYDINEIKLTNGFISRDMIKPIINEQLEH